MPGIVAPPDIEAGILTWLSGRTAVTSLAGNIGWQIKSPWPCLRIFRVGGLADEIMRVDAALVQVEAWGNPDSKTSVQRIALFRLLATTMAELTGIEGQTLSGGVYIRVRVVTSAQWAPDDATEQQRYFARLTVAAHAA